MRRQADPHGRQNGRRRDKKDHGRDGTEAKPAARGQASPDEGEKTERGIFEEVDAVRRQSRRAGPSCHGDLDQEHQQVDGDDDPKQNSQTCRRPRAADRRLADVARCAAPWIRALPGLARGCRGIGRDLSYSCR